MLPKSRIASMRFGMLRVMSGKKAKGWSASAMNVHSVLDASATHRKSIHSPSSTSAGACDAPPLSQPPNTSPPLQFDPETTKSASISRSAVSSAPPHRGERSRGKERGAALQAPRGVGDRRRGRERRAMGEAMIGNCFEPRAASSRGDEDGPRLLGSFEAQPSTLDEIMNTDYLELIAQPSTDKHH